MVLQGGGNDVCILGRCPSVIVHSGVVLIVLLIDGSNAQLACAIFTGPSVAG